MIVRAFFHHAISSTYLANSGIPFFTQSITYQVYLLIPILIIEAYIHRKILKLGMARSISIALSTNIISTLLGGTFFVLLSSSYCCLPYSFPLLPFELIVTLIPMFFISVLLEAAMGHLTLKQVDRSQILPSFVRANIFSYIMLETLAIAQLIKGYIEGRS